MMKKMSLVLIIFVLASASESFAADDWECSAIPANQNGDQLTLRRVKGATEDEALTKLLANISTAPFMSNLHCNGPTPPSQQDLDALKNQITACKSDKALALQAASLGASVSNVTGLKKILDTVTTDLNKNTAAGAK